KNKLKNDLKAMNQLQEKLYADGKQALLIIFQGMDTSGKDSMIKHVMSGVNPQGCNVHSFKAPSKEELARDYLWRCTNVVPAKGYIGIFNRSYYEEVTITRVHNFLLKLEHLPLGNSSKNIWKNRFSDINNYEKYLSRNGVCILKFFLHISEDEQKKRILSRLNTPAKHWKFDVSDIREREYWDKYIECYEDAMQQTSTAWAPWNIVASDEKWSARVCISDAIVAALQNINPEFPKLTAAGMENIKKAKKLLS
ncbi:MAG: polyphosphate kinase 2 family protein, partial [bacterium]|nr:polyphosphate kinase 2 family protein [bacterium]